MPDLPQRADVVVIGAGFAGAATADALTAAGITRVVVLERETALGYHASGRNAALGRQITEDDEVTALTVRGMALVDERAAAAGVALVRRTGSILLVDDVGAREALLARAARFDVQAEAIDPAQLVRRWPALAGVRCAGGVAFPGDGVLDVHALLSGYVAGARRRGAQVILGCDALAIDEADAGVCVRTSRGDIVARCVVDAAGAWAGPVGALAGARGPHLAPIKRHLFVSEPIAELERDAPFVWHVGAREFYVRPEGAGYLLSGCDETEMPPHDAVPSADALDGLADRLHAVAPGLVELGIARAWACLRTFAPDRRPIIDWDAEVPWLFWVAGLGGHGATASAAVGERAAARIVARLGLRLA